MKTFNYTTAMIRNPSTQKFESIPALSGGGSAGLTQEQINALDGMFKACAYSTVPTAEYEAFKKAFGISSDVSFDSYSVTNNLTNITNSNNTNSVKKRRILFSNTDSK